jgi:hypothetical protein
MCALLELNRHSEPRENDRRGPLVWTDPLFLFPPGPLLRDHVFTPPPTPALFNSKSQSPNTLLNYLSQSSPSVAVAVGPSEPRGRDR